MANSLATIGLFTSAERLREQLVQYLHENDVMQGLSLALFVERPWSQYLRRMSQDGTYGDRLTLQVAADMLGPTWPYISGALCRKSRDPLCQRSPFSC